MGAFNRESSTSRVYKLYDRAFYEAKKTIATPLRANCGFINPASMSKEPEILERKIRHDTPAFFLPIFTEMEKAFSLICASPNRAEYFLNGYAFPLETNINPHTNQMRSKWNSSEISELQQEIILRYVNDHELFVSDVLSGEDDIYINSCDYLCEPLIDALCKLSRYSASHETAKRTQKLRFLVGDIGEGKTIFVNYLISVYLHSFHKNRVVPIKVDLTHDDISVASALEKAIYKKFIWVISQKYLNPSGRASDSEIGLTSRLVNLHINKLKNKSLKQRLINFVKRCSDGNSSVLGYLSSIANRTDSGLLSLYSAIRDALDDIDYGVYLIIDGMDNFNRDKWSEELFTRRVKEAMTFILRTDDLRSGYLIVTRRESFDFIKTYGMGRGSDHKLTRFSLLPITPCQILEAKNTLTAILIGDRRKEEQAIDQGGDMLIDSNRGILQDLFSLRKFINPLTQLTYKTINNAVGKMPLPGKKLALTEVFQKNNRIIQDAYLVVLKAIMNRIEYLAGAPSNKNKQEGRYLIHRYLEDLFASDEKQDEFVKKYHYIAKQALMLNRLHICMPRYCISCDNKDSPHHNRTNENDTFICGPRARPDMWDCTFFLNVFDICSPDALLIEETEQMHYFVIIRILQYLESKDQNFIREDKIIEAISRHFGYCSKSISVSIEMLFSNELIDVLYISDSSSLIGTTKAYRISLLGRYLINKLMFDFGYISHCSDYLWVEMNFGSKYLTPPISITIKEPLISTNFHSYKHQFGSLLAKKIARTIVFSAYISVLEEAEEQEIICRFDNEQFVFRNDQSRTRLRIRDRLKNNIVDTAEKILSGKSDFIKAIVNPEFNEVCRGYYGVQD